MWPHRRAKVPGNLPHVSAEWWLAVTTPTVERVVAQRTHKTIPFSCENFGLNFSLQ